MGNDIEGSVKIGHLNDSHKKHIAYTEMEFVVHFLLF